MRSGLELTLNGSIAFTSLHSIYTMEKLMRLAELLHYRREVSGVAHGTVQHGTLPTESKALGRS